jgi:23S rRNA (uridine2552-2'-O)-methyltransferase
MLRSSLAPRASSRRWVQEQTRDRFVRQAARDGYIARSAYKLLQMDDRFGLFARTSGRRGVVVDLGAAPGGWSQVARERCSDETLIIGVDRLPLRCALVGYEFVRGDFTDPLVASKLNAALAQQRVAGAVDVIMSDMCPDRTGAGSERYAIAELDLKVVAFARRELAEGGHLVMKVLGGAPHYDPVLRAAERNFGSVRVFRPDATRDASDEAFIVGLSKLAEPRTGPVVGMSSGRSRNAPRTRFVEHGLDAWPGLTKFKLPARNEPRTS